MSTVAERQAAAHEVMFYGFDGELVRVAGDQLAAGIADGGVAIAIATPDRRRRIARRIGEAGIDPERAADDGVLVLLDAADTMGRFVTEDGFDRGPFETVVGDLVRMACLRGPVHAFGEMVALLWDQGRIAEAIDLEAAWDELVAETGAYLLCGYPDEVVDDHRRTHGIARVCELHSRVLADGVFDRTWHYRADELAVVRVRKVVANMLRSRGVFDAVVRDAVAVVAEMANNAVRHATTPFSVTVTVDDARVHVQVRDGSDQLPEPRCPGPREPRGRGLRLVNALAEDWGVHELPAGKLVWAELDR